MTIIDVARELEKDGTLTVKKDDILDYYIRIDKQGDDARRVLIIEVKE